MNSARPGQPMLAARIYDLLLRAYPPAFRAEFAHDMRGTFRDWHADRTRGLTGGFAFWSAVLFDVLRSAPREWSRGVHFRRPATVRAAVPAAVQAALSRARSRSTDSTDATGSAGSTTPGRTAPRPRGMDGTRPPYGLALIVSCGVFLLYVATLAPSIGFWDSGEYTAVAHTLGIPHPPGSPLFVLLAHAWEILLAPTGLSVALRVNLFSAALSAAAHSLWFLVIDRALTRGDEAPWLRRCAATAAVLVSATAFTVWNQSNISEKVYSISFLTTALAVWLILRWRDTGHGTALPVLVAFLLSLSTTNHLMGVLVAPALLVMVLLVDRRFLLRPRFWLAALPAVAVAQSVTLFLPLRAARNPVLSEAQPVCESIGSALASIYRWGGTQCEALSAVLSRSQYGKPSILLDPTVHPYEIAPRSLDQIGSQLLNYLQYLDWQWARGVVGSEPVLGGTRPLITLLFIALGLIGLRMHWRRDRVSAACLGTLFLTLSIGLVGYINFRYGFAIGWERFPAVSMHEVRERDYFFLIGFSVWGLWAGAGVVGAWSWLARGAERYMRRPRLATSPALALAFLPLILNWSWASRANDLTARDFAYNVLMSVQPYGVLVTNGDNDTFPLWYLQEVEGIRRDVTVMVSTYLNTPWYVKQLRQLTEPCPPGVDPADDPTRIICQRPVEVAGLPPALLQAGWGDAIGSPSDSVLPLSDEEIEAIAERYVVTEAPMALRAGTIDTTVPAGTYLAPADTLVAAMLKASIGERAIHFMPGSPIVATLGLFPYTVRQGLTWKIADWRSPRTSGLADVGVSLDGGPGEEARQEKVSRQESVPGVDGDEELALRGMGATRLGANGMPDAIVSLAGAQYAATAGAAIDLTLTDTLMNDVYLRRGRIMDPDAPWTDAATSSIPVQYAYAHHAAGQGHARLGRERMADEHFQRAQWWIDLVER